MPKGDDPLLIVPLEKTWTEESRTAAAQARSRSPEKAMRSLRNNVIQTKVMDKAFKATVDCPTCGGTGQILRLSKGASIAVDATGSKQSGTVISCPTCGGTGKVTAASTPGRLPSAQSEEKADNA